MFTVRFLYDLIVVPSNLSNRSLMLHLGAKALLVTSIMVILWVTRTQANVVYEAF